MLEKLFEGLVHKNKNLFKKFECVHLNPRNFSSSKSIEVSGDPV